MELLKVYLSKSNFLYLEIQVKVSRGNPVIKQF